MRILWIILSHLSRNFSSDKKFFLLYRKTLIIIKHIYQIFHDEKCLEDSYKLSFALLSNYKITIRKFWVKQSIWRNNLDTSSVYSQLWTEIIWSQECFSAISLSFHWTIFATTVKSNSIFLVSFVPLILD